MSRSLFKICLATKQDLPKILVLQHTAFRSEAVAHGDFKIPPLLQTFEEVEEEFLKGIFLKAVDQNQKIVGSIRAFREDETVHVAKLIVEPPLWGQGIGKTLILAMEQRFSGVRFEIFTSVRNLRAVGIYESLGYEKFCTQKVNERLALIYLEKIDSGE